MNNRNTAYFANKNLPKSKILWFKCRQVTITVYNFENIDEASSNLSILLRNNEKCLRRFKNCRTYLASIRWNIIDSEVLCINNFDQKKMVQFNGMETYLQCSTKKANNQVKNGIPEYFFEYATAFSIKKCL